MSTNFKAAWWLNSPHLQTLWPTLLRPRKKLNIYNERVELNDGDFLDLAWVGKINTPIVLILHGLNGSINSSYVNGMLHAIHGLRWRGVLMHFRGCSGTPNRLPRSYHAGETGDLYSVLKIIRMREPTTPIYIIGYSLGGNVLLKALGEGNINQYISAAVAVSVPFELDKTADYMCSGFSRIYQKHLVNGLIRAAQLKVKQGLISVNPDNLAKYSTFWEFDDAVTAPIHGFKNAAEYYKQSSCRQYLTQIKTPTLILHAQDDPFTPFNALPKKSELANIVQFELSHKGGHVGFISGNNPCSPVYWLENRIINYFNSDAI